MWYGKESETLTLARCSFCGKRHGQVTRLTPGPGHLCICNECVDFCREMVEQGHPLSQWREWQTGRTEPTKIIEPIHIAYEAVRRTVLDYIEGIEEGVESLIPLSFTELLELRNTSPQKGSMSKAARTDMLICDLGDRIATVKLSAWWGTDYLHLAKDQEHWIIVNLLRHMHPRDSNCLDNPHESV